MAEVHNENHANKNHLLFIFFPTILGQGAPLFRHHFRQKTVYLYRSMRPIMVGRGGGIPLLESF